MNKAEVIKGIDYVVTGLTIIKGALENENIRPVPPVSVPTAVEEKPVVAEDAPAVVGKFDVEQLNSMKYNEFKKFASSLGVKCTGTRDEIMERILALDVIVDTVSGEAVVEEPVAEVPITEEAECDTVGSSEEPVAEEVAESTEDQFDKLAEEIAKDTDLADIIGALADVGVKANKKNAVEKLADALRKGLIELDEEEDVEDNTHDEDEDVEITPETYTAKFDPKGYNDPSKMMKDRQDAIINKMAEVLTDIENGDITEEDIEDYINDFATQEEVDLLGEDYEDEDLILFLMELVKRTIDNDGEEHEPSDPYEVGNFDMCCGHELKYSKKTKKYICEQCGTEYEAE